MEDIMKEREAWKKAIQKAYRAGQYRRAWLLMAANVGDNDSVFGLINEFCENADPRPGWRNVK